MIEMTVLAALLAVALVAQSWLIVRERGQQQEERNKWISALVASQGAATAAHFEFLNRDTAPVDWPEATLEEGIPPFGE